MSVSKPGLVAGSHKRNELHVMHGYEEPKSPLKNATAKICGVCGDQIGRKENGDLFVACTECGFPVCKPCYEYERSEGNQCCPQCNTRYKRHKGCPRVPGDEEESGDVDDFEDEFRLKNHQETNHEYNHAANRSENGDNDQVQHRHPNGPAFSSIAGSVVGKDFDGEKDGYSNVEWKERVEKWKARQEKKGLINKEDGGKEEEEEDDHFDTLGRKGHGEMIITAVDQTNERPWFHNYVAQMEWTTLHPRLESL
ncbi:hypothetical protein ACLOJK_007860 [Asimina triloba]